jgi:hypothetical protein
MGPTCPHTDSVSSSNRSPLLLVKVVMDLRSRPMTTNAALMMAQPQGPWQDGSLFDPGRVGFDCGTAQYVKGLAEERQGSDDKIQQRHFSSARERLGTHGNTTRQGLQTTPISSFTAVAGAIENFMVHSSV